MKAIAAVDENWGIGREGKLLVRIPGDQKNFRDLTINKAVILGRKTMDTFPQRMPLQGRTNIILTRNPEYSVRGGDAVIVHDMDELEEAIDALAADGIGEDDIWVIGGESIYRQFIDRCDEAVITRIDRSYEADAFFPRLDGDPAWELISESEEQIYFDTTYRYQTWTRNTTAN